MKRTVTSLLFLALMAAGPHAPAAAPQPAPPATQPAGPRPMPNDYLVLLAKSIFASHKQTASKQSKDAPPPEAGLALEGVVGDDATFVALVEDTSSHKTVRLRVGDAVGRGHVQRITLHGIEYGGEGGIARVEVGQTLSGGTAVVQAPDQREKIHHNRHEEASAR